MLRHALAPVLPSAAAAVGIPRTLAAGSTGIALTFDDGPHPEGTPAVLDVLARAGYRATFFVIGEQVERRPELVREIINQGHLVAVHGYRHRLQPRLSGSQLRADLDRALETIEGATGAIPKHHRPPYGVYSPAGLRLAVSRGLKPLLWSRWGKDWRRFTNARRIAARATRSLRAGDVVLLHDADFYSARDSHRRTVDALRLIVEELERLEVGTVLPA
jgi:peptidoglycan/xylan/chitin deacetylase (PgdA/CDA1 family)